MEESKLAEIIQLPLNSTEMQLIALSLRYGMASVRGDIMDGLRTMRELSAVLEEMQPSGYNAVQERIVRLSQAGFTDVIVMIESDPHGECTHCHCIDNICCWCGREKL